MDASFSVTAMIAGMPEVPRNSTFGVFVAGTAGRPLSGISILSFNPLPIFSVIIVSISSGTRPSANAHAYCSASINIRSPRFMFSIASIISFVCESSPILFTNCRGSRQTSCVKKYSLCLETNLKEEERCNTSLPYCVIANVPSGFCCSYV